MIVELPIAPVLLSDWLAELQSLAEKLPDDATIGFFHASEISAGAFLNYEAPTSPEAVWRNRNRKEAWRRLRLRKPAARPWDQPSEADYPQMPEGWGT